MFVSREMISAINQMHSFIHLTLKGYQRVVMGKEKVFSEVKVRQIDRKKICQLFFQAENMHYVMHMAKCMWTPKQTMSKCDNGH